MADEPMEAVLLRLQRENAKLRKANEDLRDALIDAAVTLGMAADLRAGKPVNPNVFGRTNPFAVAARHALIAAKADDE